MPTVDAIKELREKTGAGIMDCKKALAAACDDFDKACDILKEKGLAIAAKKAARTASMGLVEIYVHGGGRVGSMVEVNCETDFVARTDQFKQLAHDIAMQVAAMNPAYICEANLPKDNKDLDPKQVCLLSQAFIKDQQKTIQDIITEVIAKVGENIQVRRFVRYELGLW